MRDIQEEEEEGGFSEWRLKVIATKVKSKTKSVNYANKLEASRR